MGCPDPRPASARCGRSALSPRPGPVRLSRHSLTDAGPWSCGSTLEGPATPPGPSAPSLHARPPRGSLTGLPGPFCAWVFVRLPAQCYPHFTDHLPGTISPPAYPPQMPRTFPPNASAYSQNRVSWLPVTARCVRAGGLAGVLAHTGQGPSQQALSKPACQNQLSRH